MNINEILDDIKSKLTGDPQKDGPFLKSQSEKYKEHEDHEVLNRELAKLLYQIASDDYYQNMDAFLAGENKEVDKQLENVRKRYKNHNYTAGIEILEQIIKNNIFAWIDTDTVTYKSFGTPIEHALYLHFYGREKEIRSISCDLSEVYYLYGIGLMKKERFEESKKALEKALEYNPVNAQIILEYLEVLKALHEYENFRLYCDKALSYAVTKLQLGQGYFNYAFYFAEIREMDKASMMLEMCRIFYNDEIVKRETEYINKCRGAQMRSHSPAELAAFLESEKIQPGPSAAVVQLSYQLGQRAERELDYKMAKYYYETVLEMTEDDNIRDNIETLERTINNLNESRQV